MADLCWDELPLLVMNIRRSISIHIMMGFLNGKVIKAVYGIKVWSDVINEKFCLDKRMSFI